ncbi:hypothetical protein LCGC14_0232100 [marine sediment metagenome]|uniref:Uncharacterized protein n=1 Tax=marine sediment metagenome TaxID=412755 RepID=A0A0F9URG1_9ZZZZ
MLTINTAAVSTKLTTLSRVKREMDIDTTASSSDKILDETIQEASDWITRYTGRTFALETVTETMDTAGRFKVVLEKTPIVSIVQVTRDGTTISSTVYEVENAKAGIVWNESGWTPTQLLANYIETFPTHEGRRDWSFNYIAGYQMPGTTASTHGLEETLPKDLERACIDLVKTNYFRRGDDPRVVRQGVGDTFEQLSREAIPPTTLQILDRWKRIDI